MAKKNNKTQKMALGGEAFHIESPSEAITKGNINYIKNRSDVLDSTQYLQDIGNTLGFAGSILQSNAGNGGSLTNLFKKKN